MEEDSVNNEVGCGAGRNPPHLSHAPFSKGCALSQFRFHLAIENHRIKDYASEKLWNGLIADTVVVYLGAYNATERFSPTADPPSFIDASTFESPAALAAYLKQLASNDTLYTAQRFGWRKKPLRQQFLKIREWSLNTAFCRFCEKLAARNTTAAAPH